MNQTFRHRRPSDFFKLRNICLSLSATMNGSQIEVEFVPFRWAAPAFRTKKDNFLGDAGWHLFGGPFHVWTMSGLSALFDFTFKLEMNPFHGGALIPKRPNQSSQEGSNG